MEKQIWDTVECRWVKANRRTWYGASPRNRRVVEKRITRLSEDPPFPKQEPFYCCICKKNTDGLSTCHLCGHMKGRWKTDTHHCEPSQEFIKEQREKLNKRATQEFHKLLIKSKELGFH